MGESYGRESLKPFPTLCRSRSRRRRRRRRNSLILNFFYLSILFYSIYLFSLCVEVQRGPQWPKKNEMWVGQRHTDRQSSQVRSTRDLSETICRLVIFLRPSVDSWSFRDHQSTRDLSETICWPQVSSLRDRWARGRSYLRAYPNDRSVYFF